MPVWQDIPGCTGYQASDDAEIRDARTGRIKKQRKAGNGSLQVDIGKSTRMVHDLVARAFHGRPAGPGYRPKHRNGKLSDNRPDNLVWSGRSKRGTQAPTISPEMEEVYERQRIERLSLIELMQA